MPLRSVRSIKHIVRPYAGGFALYFYAILASVNYRDGIRLHFGERDVGNITKGGHMDT